MDLDTFLTQLYVRIDDWYTNTFGAGVKRHAGAAVRMSDSEVLTVAVAGQWRAGVPWGSERGVVRFMQQHGRGWFPTMLGKSAFNQRVRQLWAVLTSLQQTVAHWLTQPEEVYEVVDCVPLPTCSLAHCARHPRHWIADSRLGHGGNQGGWFFGQQVLLTVSAGGAVTGWLVGGANTDDRWLLTALLSGRQGQTDITGPAPAPKQRLRQTQPSLDGCSPALTCGNDRRLPLLADRGFNGQRWRQYWQGVLHTHVLTAPARGEAQPWSRQANHWLSSHRQIVETVAARLVTHFGWHHLQAHSTWGQWTRLAASTAAYNLGLYFNHLLGRPLGALETLIQ